MPTKETPIWLVVLITALVVGGAVYLLTAQEQSANTIANTESVSTGTASSREYAVMGRELWSAFQCSSWASIFEDNSEQERLFLYGYSQGQKFLKAIEDNKIASEDFEEEVPVAVSLSLQGPTHEFILGQIFAFAQDQALEDVFTTNGDYNPADIQKIIAQNEFTNSNCRLIGR